MAKPKKSNGSLLNVSLHLLPHSGHKLHLVTWFFVTMSLVITKSWRNSTVPTEIPEESFPRAAVSLERTKV